MNRIERLMQSLPDGLDAALILSKENRRYYTGFPSSAGILFVTRDQAYFLIDFRYIEAAQKAVRGCEVLLLENTRRALYALCQKHAVRAVGAELSYLTVADFQRYRALLEPAVLEEGDQLDRLILSQRRIKTPDEVEQIRRAQALTDETFRNILNAIQPGRTEREIALEMEFDMRRRGAEAVSFDFIVVTGKNSALPHGVPGDGVIKRGDFVTMDFGAVVGGYHSDMTRTVAVGEPSERQRLVYDTVLKAQLAALESIAAGRSCREIDAAARSIIDDAGFAGCFGHGLGHAVGIEIHEEPRFSPACDDTVEPGLVMTVEPGIYLQGEFGCRIEDMVYVTEAGTENLTESPKDLIVL